MSARERLVDVVFGAEFLAARRSGYPVTCLLLFVQAASYALLRVWEEGYLPVWIDFGALWQASVLSLDGYRDGKWYTLITRQLVSYDLPNVAFVWLGLWLFGSRFERRYGSLAMLVVALLSSVLAGHAFVWTATWTEAAGAVDADWRVAALDWLRPQWRTYGGVWLAEPLFVSFAVFTLLRLPWRRSLSESLPLGGLAAAALAASVTVRPWFNGMNVAVDSHLAAAALPVALLALGLPLRILAWARGARRQRALRRTAATERVQQGELDHLLAKVSSHGLAGLSVAERHRLDRLSSNLRRGAS